MDSRPRTAAARSAAPHERAAGLPRAAALPRCRGDDGDEVRNRPPEPPRYAEAASSDRVQLAVQPRPARRFGPWYRYTRRRWHVLMAVVDLVGWLLFWPGHVARRVARSGCGAGAPPRRILVVQLDHLGDAILSTGLLHALRQACPQARIDVLAAPWNRAVFDTCPAVDRVHVAPSARFARQAPGGPGRLRWIAALLRCGWRLRRQRYDLGLDIRGELPHAALLWLCGARRRVGWRAGGGGFLLTDSPRWLPGRHEVESRAALLQAAGIPCDAQRLAPRVIPSDAARRWVARHWAAHPRGEAPPWRPRVVLHLGAGTPAKCWPAAHWHELACRLLREHGARVVLVGTQEDRPAAAHITSRLPPGAVLDWTARLDFDELAALLQTADVLVGSDSAPAHLAAAVGTPVVALFSGTNDAAQWRPWGNRVTIVKQPVACRPCHRTRCAWADHPCMRGIAPQPVAEAVGAVLADTVAQRAVAQPEPSGR
jgi:lipopolysaccharide heptosyltransferase II